MPFPEADLLVDRRRLKRQVSLWRLAAILVLLGASLAAAYHLGEPRWGKGHVARFAISGVITDDAARIRTLRELAEDGRARALVLRIDSPGGTVVASEELYRQVRAIAERMPVVAVLGQTAASGGYMVALGADRIVAREGTVTGSIGVLMQTADVSGLLRKLGVSMEQIRSVPLKAVPNPLEPLTDEGRRAVREIIEDMHAMFVGMVAERRGLDADRALRVSDGRVHTGRQALPLGLVDELGGEDAALDWLARERGVPRDMPVRDVRVSRPGEGWRDLSSRAFSVLTGKSYLPERLTIDGLVALWHPDLGQR
ncbi:MAG: signal peptide peptidase SppA [Alphaproteobacteria bacterium]